MGRTKIRDPSGSRFDIRGDPWLEAVAMNSAVHDGVAHGIHPEFETNGAWPTLRLDVASLAAFFLLQHAIPHLRFVRFGNSTFPGIPHPLHHIHTAFDRTEGGVLRREGIPTEFADSPFDGVLLSLPMLRLRDVL